jgi:hypothetical protein
MGGGIALFAANVGGAMAVPLAKDCNYRTVPDIIKSLKALPDADRLLLHPILAETLYETYGKNNSPELEYLRRLDRVETGGGKLATPVAKQLIACGINLVSRPFLSSIQSDIQHVCRCSNAMLSRELLLAVLKWVLSLSEMNQQRNIGTALSLQMKMKHAGNISKVISMSF